MKKKLSLRLFTSILLICSAVLFSINTQAQSYSNYVYRKKLTLNTTNYISGSGNLTDFPVLLEITDSDLIKTGSASDKISSYTANDIAFTDATVPQNSATEYNYQIETYNPGTGLLRVWVKIPSLTKNTNNTIYMYFGSTNPPSHPNPAQTWGPDYKAVFHFNEENFSTNLGAVKDGTGANHATVTSAVNNITSGKIGSAYSFNGINQKIETSNIVNITGNFTVSAWIKPAVVNTNQKIVSNQINWENGYHMGIGADAKVITAAAKYDIPTKSGYNDEITHYTPGGRQLNADTWYYVQTTYTPNANNNDHLKTYVNGVLDRVAWSRTPDNGNILRMGVGEGGNLLWFNGLIDEVRISNETKSVEWLATEYNNQLYPGNTGAGLDGGNPFISTYEEIEIVNAPPSTPSDINPATNSIAENSANGIAVGITASSTDPDGATIIYSLTNDAGGRFAIDSSTGIITVANGALIDFESATYHTITVKASDGNLSATQDFVISVENVVESVSAPIDNDLRQNSISENASTNTPVKITAQSAHEGGRTVIYSLTDDAGGRFAIHPSTGVVYVANASLLDFEANSSHTITVQANDGTSTASQTFVILITDHYENIYGSYVFQKAITLNNHLLGISSDLHNFPTLLKIQDNNLIAGSDCEGVISQGTSLPNIAFIDPTSPTSELNYEIESYNPASGSLLVWVKIPVLKASENNTIFLYFGGNSSVTHDEAFFKATWSNVTESAKSYKGVWHFSENPSNSDIKDVSSVGTDLRNKGGVNQNLSSIIGNGVTIANGGLFQISGNEEIGLKLPTTNSTQTISFWAHYTNVPPGDSKFTMLSLQNRYQANGIQIGVRNNRLIVHGWGQDQNPLLSYSQIPSAGVWHQYTYSWNGISNKLYIDGELKASSTNPLPQNGIVRQIGFGSSINWTEGPADDEYFNGSMDEARVIDVALSDDWIKASYIIQSNPEAYTTNWDVEQITPNVTNFPGALTFTWTGAENTDITNAGNWKNKTFDVPNQLPHNSGTATIVIPSGLSNYPSLTNDLSVFGLTIESGASLSLNGHALSVKCHFINNGQLLYNDNSNSELTFNGSLPNQNYIGNEVNAETGKLKINNSAGGTVTLSSGGLDVYDLVTITNGTLASNGHLSLKASANSVANVGPLNGNQLTGNVNVESYFTGGSSAYRGTRAVSSPVNESLSSLSTYQLLKSFLVITGPGGAANGFDVGGKASPNGVSLTKYNESATLAQSQFTPVASITEPLSAGNGVFLFYRGNRSNYSTETAATSPKVNTPFAVPENTLVRYTGPINYGNITVDLSYTDHPGEETYNGYNLVGNPYPSVIDWTKVRESSINVDDELKIVKPEGGFATYLNGDTLNAGGKDLRFIQPGQAFYARANNTGASITFTEASKVSAVSTLVLPRLLSAPQKPLAQNFKSGMAIPQTSLAPVKKRLRLILQNEINKEEALIVFSPVNDAKAGREDAVFFGGSTITLSSLSSDKKQLAINNMPEISQVSEVYLSVNATSNDRVTLKFTDLSALEGTQAVLIDNFSGSIVDINSTPSYSFDINKSISASFGSDRIKLMFSPITTLPVKMVNFRAKKTTSGSELKWTTTSETNSDRFIIERSENGISFSSIGSLKAKGNSATHLDYSFIDENQQPQLVYYRIKQLDADGKFVNTAPLALDYSMDSAIQISVYPNPSSKIISIDVPDRKSDLNLSIINISGIEVKQLKIKKTEALKVDISDLASGLYVIQVIENNSPIANLKFMKE